VTRQEGGDGRTYGGRLRHFQIRQLLGRIHRALWHRRTDWRGDGHLPGGSGYAEESCDRRAYSGSNGLIVDLER
jgi:hypothetical protein